MAGIEARSLLAKCGAAAKNLITFKGILFKNYTRFRHKEFA